jgi:hypothetical protein
VKHRGIETSRLSDKIIQRLRKEAITWDRAKSRESARSLTAELEKAEVFRVLRPPREPVSVRLDPQDIFLLKRLARRHGIPPPQLIAQWVHERVSKETRRRVG